MRYEAPALEKGLDALELLSATTNAMNLSEISREVGRSRSEMYRVLQVLERRHYLERTGEDDRYTATNRLFLLGMERPAVRGLLEIGLPLMHKLSEEIEQSCHLVVPSDQFMVVIARAESPYELGLVVKIGHRRPLLEGTSGLVLVAFQPETVRAHWLQKYGATARRPSRATLLETLTTIREQGYAAIPSTVVPGVTDTSAPVLFHSAAVAALAVPYMDLAGVRMSQDEVIKALCATTNEISNRLG
ncbi:MAG TPA: IclR family transcriptional regulator [Steroidobacteraceae bacterium]|nr:IclR family transcriptional regulator [Steroidobacteraceae bacterium]